MPNQLFANPYPFGTDNTQRMEELDGSIVLCGAATASGEPVNWANILSALGFNESNFCGYGGTSFGMNNGSALVTAFAAAAGTVTATAANNFYIGQYVKFIGNTSVLGLLLNGNTVKVVTASPTQFTFLSGATGTGTGETGIAVSGKLYIPNVFPQGPPLVAAITATSAASGIITITAANKYLPGATVNFAKGGTGTILTALLAAQTSAGYIVLQSTGTAFTIASTVTGTTGTGSVTGQNAVQPHTCSFWSQNNSGYIYNYNETTGNLFVQVGGAAVSSPTANLAAGAYPAGVLGDIVKFSAKWVRQF